MTETNEDLDALRISTRPALVAAWGRTALTTLVGVALVLSVWKGFPVTASMIAAGGLVAWGAPVLRRRRPSPSAPARRSPA